MPTAYPPLAISSREHVLFVGLTQTGKTTLAHKLLQGYMRDQTLLIAVINSKGDDQVNAWVPRVLQPKHVPQTGGGLVQLRHDVTREDREAVLDPLWRRGNVIVWVDELPLVGDESWSPLALQRMYTAGSRRGIGVWALTQDPVSIPMKAKSQATHFFCFQVGEDEYVKKVARLLRQVPDAFQRQMDALPQHGCLYWCRAYGAMRLPPRRVA